MTRINFLRFFVGKTASAVLSAFLFVFGAAAAFGQTAEVRSTGVYYIDGASTINERYCNWDPGLLDDQSSYNKSAIINVGDMQTNDPWQTSALIEYDQPYPSPVDNNDYPNHCLALDVFHFFSHTEHHV